jgi:hypothetical protein
MSTVEHVASESFYSCVTAEGSDGAGYHTTWGIHGNLTARFQVRQQTLTKQADCAAVLVPQTELFVLKMA